MTDYRPATCWCTPVYWESGNRRAPTTKHATPLLLRSAARRRFPADGLTSSKQRGGVAHRPGPAETMLLELQTYIERGYWKVAIRRFLMMRAQGFDVPLRDAERCKELIARCSAAELRRIDRSIGEWARMVNPTPKLALVRSPSSRVRVRRARGRRASVLRCAAPPANRTHLNLWALTRGLCDGHRLFTHRAILNVDHKQGRRAPRTTWYAIRLVGLCPANRRVDVMSKHNLARAEKLSGTDARNSEQGENDRRGGWGTRAANTDVKPHPVNHAARRRGFCGATRPTARSWRRRQSGFPSDEGCDERPSSELNEAKCGVSRFSTASPPPPMLRPA
jgi:hypothetical protein